MVLAASIIRVEDKGMFLETSTILHGITSQETVIIRCTTMTTKKLIHFIIIITIMSGLANSQDRLRLEEQDHSDQHLSYTQS